MLIKKWESLPSSFQCKEIRQYYDYLKKKNLSLFFKRIFDIVFSLLLIIITIPLSLILAIIIKIDSKGPVFYRQERVTQYGRKFKIFKFRTMKVNSDVYGSGVTAKNDKRVTKVGKIIRKFRLDEYCQIINVFLGDMSFVGVRPEIPKFVKCYNSEMLATLLLPAGITSEASIFFRNEEELLNESNNPDKTYIDKVLPFKMEYNLESLKKYNFFRDFLIVFKTIFTVFIKNKDKNNTLAISINLNESEKIKQ